MLVHSYTNNHHFLPGLVQQVRHHAPANDLTSSETDYQNIKLIEIIGEVRRNAFAPRVVDPWNALPDEVKQAPTVNTFKNRYDAILKPRIPQYRQDDSDTGIMLSQIIIPISQHLCDSYAQMGPYHYISIKFHYIPSIQST